MVDCSSNRLTCNHMAELSRHAEGILEGIDLQDHMPICFCTTCGHTPSSEYVGLTSSAHTPFSSFIPISNELPPSDSSHNSSVTCPIPQLRQMHSQDFKNVEVQQLEASLIDRTSNLSEFCCLGSPNQRGLQSSRFRLQVIVLSGNN